MQKAPAATIGDLALALKKLFNVKNEIKIIGTRHGEKLYETLLTREEMIRAHDLETHFRVPMDNRDLNYNKYFVEGKEELSCQEDYNSHNTRRLNVDEIMDLLLKQNYIQKELKAENTEELII